MSGDLHRRPLSDPEREQLASCEATIEQGLATFIAVGNALMTIRDSRLYRQGFASFEDYCRQRWGMSRPRAYQLIDAASVSTVVDTANEAQARELAPLKSDEGEILTAWRDAQVSIVLSNDNTEPPASDEGVRS